MRKGACWSLFGFVFLTECAVGFYISHVIGYVHSDAISRVANAFYVLFSRDPHLAAIGFVWNPLPSLMEIIFLLPYPVFPELASSGLAGVLMSSLFAGLTAVMLAQACIRFGLTRRLSVAFSLLFAFNPFIFLFGANGLSDAPFFYFTMYTVVQLTLWIKWRETQYLIGASFMLALAFWTRYEAVPFGAAIALGIMLTLWFIPEDRPRTSIPTDAPLPSSEGLSFSAPSSEALSSSAPSSEASSPPNERMRMSRREAWHRIEGTLVLVLAPIFYSGLLWILLNYIIMGNPLYFLNSEYSNVRQSQSLANDPAFARMMGNPLLVSAFVAGKAAWYSIPLAAIVFLRLWNRRWFGWDVAVLLGLNCSILALQWLLLVNGTSFGWFRYFMYVFPITVAWIPYELSKLKPSFFNSGVALAGLALSAGVLTYAITRPEIAPDENKFLRAREFARQQQVELEVAAYMDAELADRTILMDSYSAYFIILNSRRPERYIITSDYVFREALADPVGTGVDYILSPKPNESSAWSAEQLQYPDFYEKGADFARLHKQFGDRWRLYEIVRDAAAGFGNGEGGGTGSDGTGSDGTENGGTGSGKAGGISTDRNDGTGGILTDRGDETGEGISTDGSDGTGDILTDRGDRDGSNADG